MKFALNNNSNKNSIKFFNQSAECNITNIYKNNNNNNSINYINTSIVPEIIEQSVVINNNFIKIVHEDEQHFINSRKINLIPPS